MLKIILGFLGLLKSVFWVDGSDYDFTSPNFNTTKFMSIILGLIVFLIVCINIHGHL